MAFNFLNKDGLTYFWNKIKARIGTATLTTTAQDLSGAVNELNSKLSYTNIESNVALSISTTVKKISSIAGSHNILLIGKANAGVRGSLLIPYSVFASGKSCYIPIVGGTIVGGVVMGTVYVKYVSDTSIEVQASNDTFNYLDIYAN
jgi:hypothetical protein